MRFRYDVLDISQDVTIVAPPPSEVTDIEDLEGSFGLEPESRERRLRSWGA